MEKLKELPDNELDSIFGTLMYSRVQIELETFRMPGVTIESIVPKLTGMFITRKNLSIDEITALLAKPILIQQKIMENIERLK